MTDRKCLFDIPNTMFVVSWPSFGRVEPVKFVDEKYVRFELGHDRIAVIVDSNYEDRVYLLPVKCDVRELGGRVLDNIHEVYGRLRRNKEGWVMLPMWAVKFMCECGKLGDVCNVLSIGQRAETVGYDY